MTNRLGELESAIRGLTIPVLGQYPRPWMTEIDNPSEADIFVIGANQATAYAPQIIGSHDRFLDAHFNRNGLNCRALYEEVRGKPSLTRSHSDTFVDMLKAAGAEKLIETNAVCFSTPNAEDLKRPSNKLGLEKGVDIFRELVRIISPKVAIVHGSGTVKMFKKYHGISLPDPPQDSFQIRRKAVGSTMFIVIPTLGAPAVNKWHSWRSSYLQSLAGEVATLVGTQRGG